MMNIYIYLIFVTSFLSVAPTYAMKNEQNNNNNNDDEVEIVSVGTKSSTIDLIDESNNTHNDSIRGCHMCQNNLSNFITLKCEHTVCTSCCNRFYNAHRRYGCPVCKEKICCFYCKKDENIKLTLDLNMLLCDQCRSTFGFKQSNNYFIK